jgi:hypothetical protein
MKKQQVAPYGSWKSPIRSDIIASGSAFIARNMGASHDLSPLKENCDMQRTLTFLIQNNTVHLKSIQSEGNMYNNLPHVTE